jgi:hypothetical protein
MNATNVAPLDDLRKKVATLTAECARRGVTVDRHCAGGFVASREQWSVDLADVQALRRFTERLCGYRIE